jgi:hypothetical protein
MGGCEAHGYRTLPIGFESSTEIHKKQNGKSETNMSEYPESKELQEKYGIIFKLTDNFGAMLNVLAGDL